MSACHPLPGLEQVARSFGKAAASYDRYAQFQRDVADRLLAAMVPESAAQILDLGSGTGYCAEQLRKRYPQPTITNLDVAKPMLAYARDLASADNQHWVCSDAQCLPFRDNSFDLAVSSLTLQWCPQPAQYFAELYRVLKPGGRAWVSTLAVNTLKELRESWAMVDSYVHVNSFLEVAAIKEAVLAAPFTHHDISNEQEYYYYESLAALTRELKGIGANNHNAGRASGLTGKQKLRRLKSVFEQRQVAGRGIPVTYDLVVIALEK